MTYAWFDVTRNAGIARIMHMSYRSKTYTWNDVILVKRSMIRVFSPLRLSFCSSFDSVGGPEYRSQYSDSLWAGRFGNQVPARARFTAPVQTGVGDHPVSYTMSTESFPEVKRRGRRVDYPPPTSAEVKERPSWPRVG